MSYYRYLAASASPSGFPRASRRAGLLLIAGLLGLGCGSDPPTPGPSPPVAPPPLLPMAVRLVPDSAVLEVGDSVRFTVQVKNVDTTGGFLWGVLDSSVAVISANGVVRGVATGRTQVVVRPSSDRYIARYAPVIVR